MVFLRDVTSSRQIEEELRQSQKIEAVGRLAGGVAHDFNNLLSVINSYADLMTLKLPEGDPLRKYVGSIRTAGQRAADLVGKLLTFSRRDSVKPTLVDVRSVTEEMQKMLRRVIREDIDISMNFDENMMALWADPLQLEQLIMNLCVNARDAIESENKNGGRINLSWKEATLNEAEATKKKLTAGNYLAFSVSDTGCGIEPKIVAKIFEPYFTTKASGKGTGLGLSIVYAIVQQLKGAIEVESTLGKGTTFRVYFPASDRPARTKSQMPIVEAPQHGDEHIMVVEDEENFSECLHSLLTLHGYKVHCAKDAVQAEEIFKQSIYPIKLLITDVVLPNTSGQAMARKMKDERPELKVIFMSGYDHSLKILQEFPYTALVLQKPFSVVSILNKIREVLDKPQEEKKIQVI
jgi:nitrogen-specific signal transduction histidine kinase/ActR/RegA family two-component response regulator